MFSFRTTSLIEQEDVVLHKGRVGVFCDQSAWDPESGKYLFEILSERGNLKKIFWKGDPIWKRMPKDSDVIAMNGNDVSILRRSIDVKFSDLVEDLKEIDAMVIEVQDSGVRYCEYEFLLFNLFETLNDNSIDISVYVVDRENPTGRQVGGTMLQPEYASVNGVPEVLNRHGLTFGELANFFYSETSAKFPLHIISYFSSKSTKYLMPWSIPSLTDVSGLFTSTFLSGIFLFNGLNISVGIGTNRPYEFIGSPDYLNMPLDDMAQRLYDPGVFIRPTCFIPRYGLFAGAVCYGFQFLPNPGDTYHSMAHSIRVIKELQNVLRDENKSLISNDRFKFLIGDDVLLHYLNQADDLNMSEKESHDDWAVIKEHIKVDEQKWIRKAKRFMLYDDNLWRIKTII
ncbi:MAG: exo-beta-N-acetylmuramidase NamZ domain-containing protein [Bacteroidales bacterium]